MEQILAHKLHRTVDLQKYQTLCQRDNPFIAFAESLGGAYRFQ
jgi:hypothetical protein